MNHRPRVTWLAATAWVAAGLWLTACAQGENLSSEPVDSGLEDGGGDTGVGGSAGSPSDGGADASDAPADAPPDACQCDDPGCGQCPATSGVAAGGYTIDSTEVSNDEYAAWLSTQPDVNAQSAACAWNAAFVPDQGWPAAGGDGAKPVVYVDHCDAQAYCHWAKKRLCGRIGGGGNPYAAFDDAAQSQWFNACSGSGVKTYPYGAQYSPTACNGADFGTAASVAVGSATGCEGGYPNLFDMSGNVWEWEDSCQGAAGEADLCRIRGGSFSQGASALGCAADSALARNTTGKSVGFRCCE